MIPLTECLPEGDRKTTRRLTVMAKPIEQNEPVPTTLSPRDPGSSRALCQHRVNMRVVQDMMLKSRLLEDEQIKQAKNREVSHRAALAATERIKEKKRQENKALEDGVEVLILNQPSSIEAMNIARMLSPRFAETINYTPHITKNSAQEERLKALMGSDRVGAYYR
ncbi:unnamed protein product [Aphanomyces euteiches]